MNDQSPPSRSRGVLAYAVRHVAGWGDDHCTGSYRSLMVAINVIDHDGHAMGTGPDSGWGGEVVLS